MLIPDTGSEINLFCLPFAGGNKYSYRLYNEQAPPFLKLIPLELPGRGARIREPLLTQVDAMVDDMFAQMKPHLHKPYAIYGHSMGAMLTYLITRRIVEEKLYNKPLHLFLTGCSGPSARDINQKRHLLPKNEFIAKLKEYGGSPDEILYDEGLMNFFEPILRADFKGIENYVYQEVAPMDIPMTVIIGTDEPVTTESAEAWKLETSETFELHQFSGKHFFIFEHAGKIMRMITQELQKKTLQYKY